MGCMNPVSERFWSKVEKTETCWYWTAGLSEGYGRFALGRTMVISHRWAYAERNGEIPSGMTIDHECHNSDEACIGGPTCLHRRCVNPDHLTLRSAGENTLASSRTTASKYAARTRCDEGHELVYEASSRRRVCIQCRRERQRKSTAARRHAAGVLEGGRGIHGKLKTHCPQGHEYNEANTRVKKSGGRSCRACDRERDKLRNRTERIRKAAG